VQLRLLERLFCLIQYTKIDWVPLVWHADALLLKVHWQAGTG
jgi:hypothetical protein